ncbi:DUF4405 domain-containing protein [bacterium]|nr:DUF4405 domain-containing protein [bacterium]
MSTNTNKRPNSRAIIAIGLALCSIGLPLTGVGMEMLHHGSPHAIREAWAHTHVLLGLIFIVLFVWHVSLNWRSMLKHLGVSK